MLITALCAWFTRPGAQIPTWYRAHSDPMIGPALRLLRTDPAHPWTLRALAANTGVSRAHLARRFNTLVGQPPMTYLRQRRLTLAADLLREPDTTLAVVAEHVGFANAFALSNAFKKGTRRQPERIPPTRDTVGHLTLLECHLSWPGRLVAIGQRSWCALRQGRSTSLC